MPSILDAVLVAGAIVGVPAALFGLLAILADIVIPALLKRRSSE